MSFKNLFDLTGKTALVTAAGQGIGKASALAMVAHGAQVVATDANPALLENYSGVPNIRTVALEVLDRPAIGRLVSALPRIDVLFNCAGIVHNGTVLQATDDEWSFAFNLNVRSQFWMIQAVLPKMLALGAGCIINMTSVCGSLKGLPNRFVYGASKAAVVGLTKSVAADYVGRGIRCNAIAPGTVDTPSLQRRIDSYPDPVQARKDFVARQPMGRLAQAEEIAPIVLYLASDDSVFSLRHPVRGPSPPVQRVRSGGRCCSLRSLEPGLRSAAIPCWRPSAFPARSSRLFQPPPRVSACPRRQLRWWIPRSGGFPERRWGRLPGTVCSCWERSRAESRAVVRLPCRAGVIWVRRNPWSAATTTRFAGTPSWPAAGTAASPETASLLSSSRRSVCR